VALSSVVGEVGVVRVVLFWEISSVDHGRVGLPWIL
jgi:hypothetical protein